MQLLLTSHCLEVSHMVMLSSKGGWEVYFILVYSVPSCNCYYFDRKGDLDIGGWLAVSTTLPNSH